MGFQFLPTRKAQATPRPKGNASEGPGTSKSNSAIKRPQKLLSKFSTKFGKAPATPHNTAPSSTTPTTAIMQSGGASTAAKPTLLELKYHDSVTHSLLEEQERIRQQLFYEEEGVEVTAQFQSPPNRPGSVSRPPRTLTGRDQLDEEKKDESSVSSSSILSRLRNSATKKKKRRSRHKKEPEQQSSPPPVNVIDTTRSPPVTPLVDPIESDPVQTFPAVMKAVALAKEEQLQRNASLASRTASSHSAASSSVVARSTLSHDDSKTQAKKTPEAAQKKKKKKKKAPRSPVEKPFDEAGDDSRPFDEAGADSSRVVGDDDSEDGAEDIPDLVDDDGVLVEEMFQCGVPICGETPADTTTNNASLAVPATVEDGEVNRQLFDVFNCGNDPNTSGHDFTEFSGSTVKGKSAQRSCRLVDSFYDNTCWTYQEAISMNRPFYDEAFSQKFLKDITTDGVSILWHLPPNQSDDASADSVEWSGRSVIMTIQQGSCYSNNSAEPKLVWTTLGGGKKEKVARCKIPLMAIQSIATFGESMGDERNEIKEEEVTEESNGVNLIPMEEDEDVCLFSITTSEGDVQVFEASTVRERDLFVAGLKNVIARLSFHVIVGDAGASSELYVEEKDIPPGEMPSIASPVRNMNRIAHAMMD